MHTILRVLDVREIAKSRTIKGCKRLSRCRYNSSHCVGILRRVMECKELRMSLAGRIGGEVECSTREGKQWLKFSS